MTRLPVHKIVTVVGARPQFIKAAPLSRALAEFNASRTARMRIQEVVTHTGQHYDPEMSQVFFDQLGLRPPAHHLKAGSGTQAAQTAKMLTGIARVLTKERPALLLVYGDTNSTLAGTLAAAKLQIPVAHVEAGLRSFNRTMPEEINRLLTDRLATLLFAPTPTAVQNLRREGITDHVHLVGDVMYDAVLEHAALANRHSGILQALRISPKQYFLATVHRAENTDDPKRLRSIADAFARLSSDLPVVWPVHPRTRKALTKAGVRKLPSAVRRVAPVAYLDMLCLEQNARAVLTDSGGVQKEAHWLEVPCITLRDETEWVETVEAGWNQVVGTATRRIVLAVRKAAPGRARKARDFEAQGSPERIVRCIVEYLSCQAAGGACES